MRYAEGDANDPPNAQEVSPVASRKPSPNRLDAADVNRQSDRIAPSLAVRDPVATVVLDSTEPWGATKIWHRLVDPRTLDRVGEDQAEELARSNPERVWQFLRDLPLGLVLYDDQFRIVYQNRASEDMTGYPTAEFAGQSPVGLWIPAVQRVNVDEMLRRMREEKIALQGRGVHVRRDHRLRWVQWYTTPLFDGDKFVGYLGTHSELGEEVRAAKHQTELLIEAAVDIAVVQLSLHGRILSWGPNAAALFNASAKQTLGMHFDLLLVNAEMESGLSQSLLDRAQSGARTEYEGWLGPEIKTRFWGHVRLYPQRDEDGTVDALVMVTRDLTERRRNEQQVRESEALLSSIVSTASDAILGINDEGRIIFCNPAAERIFGRSALALKRDPLPAILPRGEALHQLGEARRTLSGHREDGRMLHLEVSATRSSAEGRDLLTLFARDVTERVESEHALHRYQAQLSALTRDLMNAEQKTNRRLAQLLHDQFGQTLTSLRIFVDAVHARLPESEDMLVRNGWEQISALIDRGMREVRDVLTELRPALLQEQGLAVALDNELQAQAVKRPEIRVRLQTKVAERRWPPNVEYAAFMVAREAITNAFSHSRGGQVGVKLDKLGSEGLLLTVRDDGEGAGLSGLTEKPGHLGLVGMRERALGMGAELNVISTSAQRGTTIELRYLP